MTREEAIKKLQFVRNALNDDMEIAKAYDMAIKALEQEPTTKNNLGVDCISRQAVIDLMMQKWGENFSGDDAMQESIDAIRELPSVTPQEPQSFEWCDTCKEYDQEKHCCHRWSKVIRNTVEEMKEEYIEREVLDKIRAEIQGLRNCSCGCSDGIIDDVEDILDKYKTEQEET